MEPRSAGILGLCLALAGCSGKEATTPSPDGGTGHDASSEASSDATTDVTMGDGSPIDEGLVDGPLGVNCGAAGQGCCPGEACESGGCCVDQVCMASGQSCGHGLGACSSGSCGGCGALGEPCCAEYVSETCSGLVDSSVCGGCTQTGTICTTSDPSGTCVACGGVGQKCCIDSCVGEYTVCETFADDATGQFESVCTAQCGQPGQPCCEGFVCKNEGCCMGSPGSGGGDTCVASPTCGCSAGQCTTCGLSGLPCCAGGVCQVNQGNCTLGAEGTCESMHP